MSDAIKAREALQAARELAKLATELCDAVDATGNDVGGNRGSLVVLREIGPVVDTTTKKIDAALSALDLSAIGAEGWREITEDDRPPNDAEVLMGCWESWPRQAWIVEYGLYGSTKGGWIHGRMTHWLPSSILPSPPEPRS